MCVAKRILRYVKGALSHGLHFTKSTSMELVAYCDSEDYASDPNDI